MQRRRWPRARPSPASGCPSAPRRARARRRARGRPPRCAASPTTSMSDCPPSISDSAERTSGSSSTSRTRITPTTVATPPARRSNPRCAGRAGRRAARCARAARPGPGRRPGAAVGGAPASGLASTTVIPGRGSPDERIATSEPGCVLADVGDALLHDPVDRPAGRRGHRGGGVHVVGQVDVEAERARLVDERRDVVVRRLRARRGGPGSSSRSTPSTSRSSWRASLAWPWIWPSPSRSRSPSRSSRKARAPACMETWVMRWASTSCISRAMRARSVERACDDPQLLLELGALGAGAQAPDDLAPRADVEAPAHHPGVDGEVDQRGDERVVVLDRGDRPCRSARPRGWQRRRRRPPRDRAGSRPTPRRAWPDRRDARAARSSPRSPARWRTGARRRKWTRTKARDTQDELDDEQRSVLAPLDRRDRSPTPRPRSPGTARSATRGRPSVSSGWVSERVGRGSTAHQGSHARFLLWSQSAWTSGPMRRSAGCPQTLVGPPRGGSRAAWGRARRSDPRGGTSQPGPVTHGGDRTRLVSSASRLVP